MNFFFFLFLYSLYRVEIINDLTAIRVILQEMEQQVKSGRAKSIGVSSFNESQLLNVYNHAEIKPSNLQVNKDHANLQQLHCVHP